MDGSKNVNPFHQKLVWQPPHQFSISGVALATPGL
jgi:hypothetical protein